MRVKHIYLFAMSDGAVYLGDSDNDFLSVQVRVENMSRLDGHIGHYLIKSTEEILRDRGFGHTAMLSSQYVTIFVRLQEAK